MQPTEEEKLTQEDPYIKGLKYFVALSGQPFVRWSDFWSPPDPQPDDDNANSEEDEDEDEDEEPVLEEWMKPLYDRYLKRKAQEEAAQERSAQERATEERGSQAMDTE